MGSPLVAGRRKDRTIRRRGPEERRDVRPKTSAPFRRTTAAGSIRGTRAPPPARHLAAPRGARGSRPLFLPSSAETSSSILCFSRFFTRSHPPFSTKSTMRVSSPRSRKSAVVPADVHDDPGAAAEVRPVHELPADGARPVVEAVAFRGGSLGAGVEGARLFARRGVLHDRVERRPRQEKPAAARALGEARDARLPRDEARLAVRTGPRDGVQRLGGEERAAAHALLGVARGERETHDAAPRREERSAVGARAVAFTGVRAARGAAQRGRLGGSESVLSGRRGRSGVFHGRTP